VWFVKPFVFRTSKSKDFDGIQNFTILMRSEKNIFKENVSSLKAGVCFSDINNQLDNAENDKT